MLGDHCCAAVKVWLLWIESFCNM